MLTSKK